MDRSKRHPAALTTGHLFIPNKNEALELPLPTEVNVEKKTIGRNP